MIDVAISAAGALLVAVALLARCGLAMAPYAPWSSDRFDVRRRPQAPLRGGRRLAGTGAR